MVKRGWLYGLIVFLAQTCNPYYTANDSRNQNNDEVVIEDKVYIPDEALELDEDIAVEPPRSRNRVMEEPPPPPPQEEIFKVVEEMPRFPGCEQKAIERSDLRRCSEEEMLKFVRKNITYPAIAKENKIEGRVIVQFVVGKSGKIKNAKILRDIGAGCGNEAIRVVNSMPKWIPGKQRGRPVNVQYTLPVAFKLPMDIEEAPPMPEEEKIFRVVEDMPRFPGCEDQGLNKSEKKQCSDKKMLEFIYGNLVYPEVAKQNGIEGRVILKFAIEENGDITNVQVLREPGGNCGKEAERIVKMMPKWRPGLQRGKPVKVWFTLPISFKLAKEKKGQ